MLMEFFILLLWLSNVLLILFDHIHIYILDNLLVAWDFISHGLFILFGAYGFLLAFLLFAVHSFDWPFYYLQLMDVF